MDVSGQEPSVNTCSVSGPWSRMNVLPAASRCLYLMHRASQQMKTILSLSTKAKSPTRRRLFKRNTCPTLTRMTLSHSHNSPCLQMLTKMWVVTRNRSVLAAAWFPPDRASRHATKTGMKLRIMNGSAVLWHAERMQKEKANFSSSTKAAPSASVTSFKMSASKLCQDVATRSTMTVLRTG